MAITAQQIADIRADMADPSGASEVFSDAEITRYWERTDGAEDDVQHHEAVMALMYRALLSNATKFRDYSAGATGEKLDQVYKHLQQQYETFKPALLAAQGTRRQFARALARNIPRQGRKFPRGHVLSVEDDDAGL
jgi:hypothetical protein